MYRERLPDNVFITSELIEARALQCACLARIRAPALSNAAVLTQQRSTRGFIIPMVRRAANLHLGRRHARTTI
jgi:hypothetical protein